MRTCPVVTRSMIRTLVLGTVVGSGSAAMNIDPTSEAVAWSTWNPADDCINCRIKQKIIPPAKENWQLLCRWECGDDRRVRQRAYRSPAQSQNVQRGARMGDGTGSSHVHDMVVSEDGFERCRGGHGKKLEAETLNVFPKVTESIWDDNAPSKSMWRSKSSSSLAGSNPTDTDATDSNTDAKGAKGLTLRRDDKSPDPRTWYDFPSTGCPLASYTCWPIGGCCCCCCC